MTICYLGLGSNLGSPERQLRRAIKALGKLPYSHIINIASFYRSKAWGRKTQPLFFNTVLALHTRLSPLQLLEYCQAIEQQQSRVREVKWGARTLDIDLLLFGSHTIDTPKLKIPHPQITKRDFVFVPLKEIYPGELLLEQDNKNYCSCLFN